MGSSSNNTRPIVPMTDLAAEYRDLKPEIDAAIRRVVESGSFVLGAEVKAFEAEFARLCGAQHAGGVGSGTAALHLALLACGIGPGDEVITVPDSDLPSSIVISHCGAKIVWVDVDPGTLTIRPDLIEAAIMPVHLHGHPADMNPILEIARRHGLLVIEDAALATGAEYKGRKTGSLGDAGCFSLAQGKILGAYGDAGVVVTGRREVADRIRVLRNYVFALEMESTLGGTLGFRDWRLVSEGFNERLDTLQAAIVRAKMPTLESRIARRRAAALPRCRGQVYASACRTGPETARRSRLCPPRLPRLSDHGYGSRPRPRQPGRTRGRHARLLQPTAAPAAGLCAHGVQTWLLPRD